MAAFVLVLVALAAAASWLLLRRLRRRRGGDGGTSDAALRDIVDNPRTQPDLERLDQMTADGKRFKYILLVAGAQVSEMVLVPDPANPNFSLVPIGEKPPGLQLQESVNWFKPSSAIRSAWTAIVATYSGNAFVADDWVLVPIRAFKKDDIVGAMNAIKSLDPLAVVVHYFGHGDSQRGAQGWRGDRPYLTVTGERPDAVKRKYVDAHGNVTMVTVFVPAEEQRTNAYFTDDLANDMVAIFGGTIPKVLVVDGCQLALTVTYAQAAAKLSVVAAVSYVRQDTVWAKFTELYSGDITPGAYDDFAAMPAVVEAVKGRFRALGDGGKSQCDSETGNGTTTIVNSATGTSVVVGDNAHQLHVQLPTCTTVLTSPP